MHSMATQIRHTGATCRIHLTAHQSQIRPNSSQSAHVTKLDEHAEPGASQLSEQSAPAAQVGSFLLALLSGALDT